MNLEGARRGSIPDEQSKSSGSLMHHVQSHNRPAEKGLNDHRDSVRKRQLWGQYKLWMRKRESDV
jgi:hypothetical protein